MWMMRWMSVFYDCLCRIKGITEDSYRQYFVERKDQEAVEHLFYLTSGLKSQIIGEDQILTQVKDALNLARENFAADGVLEVLFRMAATAGKRIKTEVPFSHGNPSVIHQPSDFWQRRGILSGIRPVWSSVTVRWARCCSGLAGGRCRCNSDHPSVQKRSCEYSAGL